LTFAPNISKYDLTSAVQDFALRVSATVYVYMFPKVFEYLLVLLIIVISSPTCTPSMRQSERRGTRSVEFVCMEKGKCSKVEKINDI
jgi:hypothetical protein